MLKIKQFFDTGLAHASYAIVSAGKMAVVDPARDPEPYLTYAKEQEASLEAIIETHAHADFVSAHLELHKISGAIIYTSGKADAQYPHQVFEGGRELEVGRVRLKALDTPGHSDDSICVLLVDEDGRQHAVFTGDTLFVGDVGRPDLHESADKPDSKREVMAKQLYQSLRQWLMPLPPEVMVYPAHGAGSLCGKNIGAESTSTIGRELAGNWALQQQSEEEFVQKLLQDQPFIPKYFRHAVEINRKGAADLQQSLAQVPRLTADEPLESGVLVIDARNQLKFKNRHLEGALNLMDGAKFETWLGSLLGPQEPFYLLADNREVLDRLVARTASIGYEPNIRGAMLHKAPGQEHDQMLILEHFKAAPENYTVLDVRNKDEVAKGRYFKEAISIPLHQLREQIKDVPRDRPVVVHCAAGYRSAVAYSIARSALNDTKVYDLGEAIKDFEKL